MTSVSRWYGVLICFVLLTFTKTHAQAAFEDGTKASGLDSFVLTSGSPEMKKYLYESVGGGVCLLDYDGDGYLDIYFVNGGRLEPFLAGKPTGVSNALFHNEHNGTFREVTASAGVGGNGKWGMGCSVVDYDNDGRPDLYVTNFGGNILYHNLGNGKFEDVTAKAGVADGGWATGSAWADYDGDGFPDLFVANYIALAPDKFPPPGSTEFSGMGGGSGCVYRGMPVMCGPLGLPPGENHLYHNNGDGTFTEVTAKAGVSPKNRAYSLGVIWCDLDNNNRADVFVANDSSPSYLYENLGHESFKEVGLLSGVAVNQNGTPQAAMGVTCGDYRNNGRPALYVTAFSEDVNTLFRNDGGLNFLDVTMQSGLGPATLPMVGWGTFFFDFDNDGWLDLFVADGHVYPEMKNVPGPVHYREPNLLFHNDQHGRFDVMSSSALPVAPNVGRGACFADLNNDGAEDVVVSNLDGSPTLLWNRAAKGNRFLTLTLVGTKSNRDAIGAMVRLRIGKEWQSRQRHSGESYLSSCDPRIHFGLGHAVRADEIEVLWPDGQRTILHDVMADQFLSVKQPEGKLAPH
jgi:enediyne biosynthesis protein E4